MYNCIDLFAGCGGMALGLKRSGFNHACLVELDRQAAQTLRANFDPATIVEADIIKLNREGYFAQFREQIDLLSAGPPCQSFSYAGNQRGLDDRRGQLVYETLNTIEQVQPKMVLIENVKHLSTINSGKVLKAILGRLHSLRYRTQWQILNANDYGVAQNRQRLIILATRKGWRIKLKYPTKYAYKPVLRDALQDCPTSDGVQYSSEKARVLDLVPPGGCWQALPVELQKQYMGKSFDTEGGKRGMARRLAWHEPSLTLLCSPAQKQTERCHPDHTRPLTVREYARIQGFPDSFVFTGSTYSRYRQIGNAVPVDLAEAIGKSIIRVIAGIECKYCHSQHVLHNGRRRGKQNYHCQDCDRQFIDSYSPKGYTEEVKQQCLHLYAKGMGFRAIERLTGVSHNSIINWVKKLG
ncbi:DNA-cytosine methyltransferase (plasmid) [Thalassoporum mexicanum PCC 7367]|uniref:DNA (cytosine-5-)-methyltransferase n=1 Tax=Thalassoporum mexicanum TaxID=3457544 RepID=UPI00029F962A|nr:DNA (cytosine-5-)-methyltransferase [Pseudanabaena sp. PCC 7367]AFY71954.1 DNA-cytosine methyltransferase [Pseudanabaena sp. PCC 7367]